MQNAFTAGTLACLLSIAAVSSAAASEPQPLDLPMQEVCTPAPGDKFVGSLRWECSGYKGATLRELRVGLEATHKLLVDGESATVFSAPGEYVVIGTEGVAYRFHRIMQDGTWEGIGVSVFCTRDCEANRKHAMTTPPPFPAMLELGPPVPMEPPVVGG
jgi:hypothetical protein